MPLRDDVLVEMPCYLIQQIVERYKKVFWRRDDPSGTSDVLLASKYATGCFQSPLTPGESNCFLETAEG